MKPKETPLLKLMGLELGMLLTSRAESMEFRPSSREWRKAASRVWIMGKR
jgi:hypothetical protein